MFLGVTITQTINFNIVKASQEDNCVEVTTQVCGIQRYRDATVKLTRQQYNDLEQYLVEFRARLNQTSTRDEAVPIFKEAVVELYNYGLLPSGMSAKQAQRVVIGQFNGNNTSNLFSKLFYLSNLSQYNFFSLVSGNVSEAPFLSPILLSLSNILFYNPFLIDNDFLFYLGLILLLTSAILIIGNFYINNVLSIPTSIFKNIYMDDECTGWVQTFGLLGRKRYEGTLNGLISDKHNTLEAGIIGFTGIKIHNGKSIYDYFFLGSALMVGIDDLQ